MFYDLNIPYERNDAALTRTLNFSHELGYNVVALNHYIHGKLPVDISCAIPDRSSFADIPSALEIRRRVTVVLAEPLQNARLGELSRNYDILALRPTDEKTLQLACSSYDCDIISLDLTHRHGFPFKFKTFGEAISNGKRIELCYGQAVIGDSQARRSIITNATQLIRATRGRGLIISSDAKLAFGLRGPWDVVNLAAVWGLGQEKGFEAVSKEARFVAVSAQLKRTSYRGVIDVVYGGEKTTPPNDTEVTMQKGNSKLKTKLPDRVSIEKIETTLDTEATLKGQKRKAETPNINDNQLGGVEVEVEDRPLSNRERKRRAKKAKLESMEKDAMQGVTQSSGTIT